MLEMPCATMYCTCEWYSSWFRPRSFAASHNGVRHRVQVVLLEARGQTQHVLFLIIGEGHNARDRRRGIGERAGLVEDDSVCVRNGL